ncbi:hypothetical protein Aduo_015279 [Ancylostoma duodenale]
MSVYGIQVLEYSEGVVDRIQTAGQLVLEACGYRGRKFFELEVENIQLVLMVDGFKELRGEFLSVQKLMVDGFKELGVEFLSVQKRVKGGHFVDIQEQLSDFLCWSLLATPIPVLYLWKLRTVKAWPRPPIVLYREVKIK